MNEPSDAGPPSLASLWNAPPPAERKLDLAFLPAQIRSIPAPVAKFLIKALRVDALMPVFNGIAPQVSAEDFCLGALKNLNINLVLDEDLAQRIPKEGPLVIMSNHPFGGLDGLALMAALLPHRPDFKVLINVALGIFPELRAAALPLDVLSGTAKAAAGNTGSLRAAGAHLQAGGAVGFFPSGVVSHYRRGMGVVDPEWQMAGARLARRFNAPVLPVFFHGRNSLLFSVAGMIHPLARTLLLPREMVLRGGRPIRMSVGRVIEPGTFKILGTAESLTAYSRMRCYALQNLAEGQSLTQAAERPMEPVADPHAKLWPPPWPSCPKTPCCIGRAITPFTLCAADKARCCWKNSEPCVSIPSGWWAKVRARREIWTSMTSAITTCCSGTKKTVNWPEPIGWVWCRTFWPNPARPDCTPRPCSA